MALLLANVALSDTFNTWRVRTNQINTQAASSVANNTFTGTLNTFNNTAAFKGPVTAPIITANSINGTAANFTTLQADAIDFDGDLTVDNVTANTLAGTLSTAAQPNITSTGTLTSLTVSGSMTAANADFSGPVTAPKVTANSFVGALTGAATSATSATTATTATTITLVATNTTDATHYPVFVDAATGNENPRTDTGLTYNPNSGTLAATDFNATSDIIYKEQITPIDNALEIIDQLAGKAFNWKHTGKKSYGVIAQEVEQVLPDVVTTNENGKAVNYNTLIALLIESNKQLNKKIKLLEQKI